jgi:hypothetical protein
LKPSNSLIWIKLLGSDGFTLHFYLKCWSIIKYDFIRMVNYVQKSSRMGGATNSSFLALIPKEKNASSFDRFHPISLCNVLQNLTKNHCKYIEVHITSPHSPKSRGICRKKADLGQCNFGPGGDPHQLQKWRERYGYQN